MEGETLTRYADLFGGVFEYYRGCSIDYFNDNRNLINILIRRIKLFEKNKDYAKFIKILSHKNWLLSKFSSSNKLPYQHKTIERYFSYLCKNGNLKVAQWLYSLGVVDIHEQNKALCYACFNDHLDVVQWLYSLEGVDTDVPSNYVFRHESSKVIDWLNTLEE